MERKFVMSKDVIKPIGEILGEDFSQCSKVEIVLEFGKIVQLITTRKLSVPCFGLAELQEIKVDATSKDVAIITSIEHYEDVEELGSTKPFFRPEDWQGRQIE